MNNQTIVRYQLEDFVLKQSKRLGIDFAPTRAHDTDAGADIRCVRDTLVPAHGSATVNTGLHIELPPNTKCEIRSKSGLNVNHNIISRDATDDNDIISEGLIDEGFSGTIKVKLYNLGDRDYQFHAGDKISQIVVSPVLYPTYEQVTAVQGGTRGDAGYGSTGLR